VGENMRGVLAYVILLIFTSTYLSAQHQHDYKWLFGSIGEVDSGFATTVMDFGGTPVVVSSVEGDIRLRQSNASYSDILGNLLYYTNGCRIADSQYRSIAGTRALNPGYVQSRICPGGFGFNFPQTSLFLPFPGQEETAVLLHTDVKVVTEPAFDGYQEYVRYSLIRNDSVLVLAEPLLQDTLFSSDLTACKTSDGVSWWVIQRKRDRDVHFIFKLDSTGIELHHRQLYISVDTLLGAAGGQSVFSPDGKRYVQWNRHSGINVYDFDNTEGLLSNRVHIETPPIREGLNPGGCAISSSSQFLYVSSLTRLYQYDLFADDIAESRVLIDTFDWFFTPLANNFYLMQLAPDCKIYMCAANGTNYLHTIHSPNQKGQACDFRQHDLRLPNNNNFSMPNFPMYRLGTDQPICDSSILVNVYSLPTPEPLPISVYPNPTVDELQVEIADYKSIPMQIEILDLQGSLLERVTLQSQKLQIDVLNYPPGLYLLRWRLNDGRSGVVKWVKI